MTQSNLTEIKIDSDPIAATPRTMESTFMQFIPMILIFIVFYFLLIRPQEKKRKAQEQLINSIKKGDEVITNSGIFGKIVKVNDSDSTLDVQISDGVVVKILKTMIINVISKK